MEIEDGVPSFPVAALRTQEAVSQKRFWGRYGVHQSVGCRYERMGWLPRPLIMLIWLHQQKRVSDADLADALAASERYRRSLARLRTDPSGSVATGRDDDGT